MPSIGLETSIARTYNSASGAVDGPFGRGWSWSLGNRVVADQAGSSSLEPMAEVIASREVQAAPTQRLLASSTL
jgi:hypothetical protein